MYFNTGTSLRYQYEMYNPLDDVIQISYDVIVAQHSALSVVRVYLSIPHIASIRV